MTKNLQEIGQRTIQSMDDSTEMEEELMKLTGDKGRMTRGEMEMSFPGGQQGMGFRGGRWQRFFLYGEEKNCVVAQKRFLKCPALLYNPDCRWRICGRLLAGAKPNSSRPIAPDYRKSPQNPDRRN